MSKPVVQVVGCTPATPEGVCDPCSGDGEVYNCQTETIETCEHCKGEGGSDTDAIKAFVENPYGSR